MINYGDTVTSIVTRMSFEFPGLHSGDAHILVRVVRFCACIELTNVRIIKFEDIRKELDLTSVWDK